LVEKAMRLNPHYPVYYLFNLSLAYRLTGRYEEAIAALKRGLTRNPDFLGFHLILADLHSELGREEEARAEVGEVLRINPDWSLEVWRQSVPLKDPAVVKRVLDNLRRAGLK
jgi:tetratricopeptide (TPR) repeat protein